MKLIQCREWLGPARLCDMPTKPEVRIRLMCFATHLPLPEALERILTYQNAFKKKNIHTLSVEYSLISVAEVEECSTELINGMDVSFVENLPQTTDAI